MLENGDSPATSYRQRIDSHPCTLTTYSLKLIGCNLFAILKVIVANYKSDAQIRSIKLLLLLRALHVPEVAPQFICLHYSKELTTVRLQSTHVRPRDLSKKKTVTEQVELRLFYVLSWCRKVFSVLALVQKFVRNLPQPADTLRVLCPVLSCCKPQQQTGVNGSKP